MLVQNRTHNCGELRLSDVNKKVRIVGWLQNIRELGAQLNFAVIRDYYGITQILLKDNKIFEAVKAIPKESTVQIDGTVQVRESKNLSIPTGEIEIVPDEITVLGKCTSTLPFEIIDSLNVSEDIRLKYRFLDLRNSLVKDKIVRRAQIVAELRKSMAEQNFLEISTPILTSSSPEGARDYLVPSRLYPGQFYALPQAPQQFKQILMAAGFDRYFQIAPCFRDEDARADRSPGEFYQLDMEMAFASQEDVFKVNETILPPIFKKYSSWKVSEAPFKRIRYRDALEKYGTDKPDLRIPLLIDDLTDLLSNNEFGGFNSKTIKAVKVLPNGVMEKIATRKYIDALVEETEKKHGQKLFWFKTDEQGELVGGVSKFLTGIKDELVKRLELVPNSLVVIASGSPAAAQKTAGIIRARLGADLGYQAQGVFEFCWIVDFPMYELDDDGNIGFCHNPFSMPQGGLEALNTKNPLDILAYQYDIVCNGVELSSGAVRNHDPQIMLKAFEIAGMDKSVVENKFPAMYNAFTFGAPPHAGIAPGVDRMVMLIFNEPNIREIIAFPMNKNARDLMMNAPSDVSEKQLADVHIKITKSDEKK